MNRRADPDRVASARLAGLRSRLIEAWSMTPEAADGELAAWRAEADGRGLSAHDHVYWPAAEEWLTRRRR